jgi:two-component system response regulator (stage 0 sporulation protein F)
MAYRILIVDDQKDVSRLLRSALETIEHGLEVVEAPSGEEAILEATRNKIDLLISDFRLPGITGVELMKKFRLRNPDVKVILITGVSDTRSIKEINDSKADAYFAKPVPMGDFLDAVERLLGLTRTILNKTTSELRAQEQKPEPERNSVADIMILLRKDLKANGVFLLNGSGTVQAEAGELPNPNNTLALISSLMSMHIAARKAASLFDRNVSTAHVFNSDNMDGIFLPVGTTHALFVVGKGLADDKNLSKTLERLSLSDTKILEALAKIGAVVEAPPEISGGVPAYEEPFTQPENLPKEFMEIFDQVGKKASDANSFWDTAIEKGTTFAEPDKLTYDQAARLGLTPDANDKKE